MNQLAKTLSFFFIAFFLCFTSLYAQQFQWVKGGGTIYDFSSAPGSESEQVKFMCTDANGNVYAISQIGNDPIVADTFHASPYGADQNILLTSYNCAGQMRWAKLIASSGECIPTGITTDGIGNIYVTGYFQHLTGFFHIGYDTVLSTPTYQAAGLIRLDTGGHFHWLRYVGDNTLSTDIGTGYVGGAVMLDSNNNVHFLNYMKHGVHITPSDVSVTGEYDLIYDSLGVLLSLKHFVLDSTLYILSGTIDKQSNRLYAYGYRNPAFPDSSLYTYIAAFDTARNLIWKDTLGDPTGYGSQAFGSVIADGSGHIYVSATSDGYMIYRNDTISPPPGAVGGYITFIMKADTAGNKEWVRQYTGNSNPAIGAITLVTGSKVAAVGGFYESLNTLGGPTVNAGIGTDPFFTEVDTAGNLITLRRIHGDGYDDFGYAIAADKIGNLYRGGMVADSIPDTLISAYHTAGGNTDFFVLKYGVDCSCTSMPVAAYTDTGTYVIGFTYTGTTTGLDSVKWNFGDGTTSTSMNPIHEYTAIGTYNACVTVYTSCGSDLHCSEITVACVSVPAASFSDTGMHTVGFTYTGVTTGIDSVVWNFGDGSTDITTNPIHTYSTAGTYTVCVTAYTSCGSDVACNVVVVNTTGVTTLSFSNVKVYPNPVNDELNITGVGQHTTYRLLNVTGACIQQGNLKPGTNVLSLQTLANGVYILEMTGADGARHMARVVKEQ